MERVAFDEALVRDLEARGLQRAQAFSWTRSAQTLLAELELAATAVPVNAAGGRPAR
jgi:hypothetical protein